jgi:hypothetical protein
MNWAAQWGGLTVCFSILAVYLFTAQRAVGARVPVGSGGFVFQVDRGGVTVWVCRFPAGVPCAIVSPLSPDEMTWAAAQGWLWRPFVLVPTGTRGVEVRFPLWPLFVAAALLTARTHATYRRNRWGEHSCPSCGYDLSGLPPGSPCPECAAAPPPVVES